MLEETGIGDGVLRDWAQPQRLRDLPGLRHRYAPGVTQNTEHVFGLTLARRLPVTLSPREHLQHASAAVARSGAALLLAEQRRGHPATAAFRGPTDPSVNKLNPLQSTLMPPYTGIGALRVATYNITRACAASACASGWRSTTWAWR